MTFIVRIFIAVAAVCFTLPPCAFALESPDSLQPSSPETVISLITCAPGSNIYELEGHSGLRIKSGNSDYVVNWGLFDFDAPNFVYRFVKGETDYMAGAIPTADFVRYYTHSAREVTEQVLNLNDAETARIVNAVSVNLLPENRTYRYNYVHDNCATRILDIIRTAASDTLSLPATHTSIVGPSPTFRSVMRHYHARYPWYQFGIDLALGSGIDNPISTEQATFAPVLMQQIFQHAAIGGRPLVASTSTLSAAGDATLPPTPWYLTPLAVFSLLFVLAILITWLDLMRRKVSRWFDTLIFTAFGLTGCVITFLVFISSHEATSPNLLILWLNPLCLLVPACIWIAKASRFLISYQILNFAAICIMIILLPVMNQTINLAIIPLVATDMIRSLSYIYITRCERKRKNLYRIRYSA